MSMCPQCCHSLRGLDGAPSEPHGRFTRETRCPECAFAVPADARVVVGASESSGVGGRLSGKLIIGYIALLVLSGPSLFDFLQGLVQDPSLGYLSRSAASLLPLAAVAWSVYSIVAGIVHVSGAKEPADITARIRTKSRWLVQPGKVEVFQVSLASDPRRRTGASVDSDSSGVSVHEIDAESLRTIFAMEVPARRGVRGRVLDVSARRDGQGGVAASMFVVTTVPAAQFANDLLETVRERGAAVREPETASVPAASPSDDPAEPITHVEVDRITVSGSPFEPKLLADARFSTAATGPLAIVGFLVFVGGTAMGVWGSRGTRALGGVFVFIGFAISVNALYSRYRASPARWIATPGALCIERYTRLVPLLGPKVRTIRTAKFGSVQVADRQGVPVLEVRKAGARKPYAILVSDDLRGRDPTALAAAIEAMVRRVN